MTAQEAQHQIDLWLAIIAGDGLTDADLFRAAVALRLAARAKRNAAMPGAEGAPEGSGDVVSSTTAATKKYSRTIS